jgi:spore germination protein GerM
MAITSRFVALTLVAAVSTGVGTWVAVRYVVRPQPPRPSAASAAAQAGSAETRRIKAALYYIAADGLRLQAAQRDVAYADGTPDQAKRILEALLGPPPPGMLSAIPPGTALRGVYLAEGGAAYVDFTAALQTNHPGGSLSEILTVYAIVSSVTANLPAVTAVQILIDGHEADTLAGHVDLRRPLPPSAPWTEKGPS